MVDEKAELIVVFTAKSVDRIVREGGTSAWRLAPWRARHCAYAVCTRNAYADWVEGTEEHRSAFLVGKISGVVPSDPTGENDEAKDHRYLLEFSEFARVSIPDVWQQDRNPVKYEAIDQIGIDFSSLKWEPMPTRSFATAEVEEAKQSPASPARPLSLAEARKGLALTFNVSPDAIEITIRG
jgi:hypothetical protein